MGEPPNLRYFVLISLVLAASIHDPRVTPKQITAHSPISKAEDKGTPSQFVGAESARLAGVRSQPLFRDITRQSGIDFRHINSPTPDKYMPETMGSGVVFFDF